MICESPQPVELGAPVRREALPPNPRQATSPVKAKRHKAGRKPATKDQRESDKAIHDAWMAAKRNAGYRLTIKEFAEDRGKDIKAVKRAIDNHRKRVNALDIARGL
jgi:hypothetical protein